MGICEIQVYLLDEGTDVWRPVKAKKIGLNKYEIIGIDNYDPDDEKWQFLPGDIVECEIKELMQGVDKHPYLVAVRKVEK